MWPSMRRRNQPCCHSCMLHSAATGGSGNRSADRPDVHWDVVLRKIRSLSGDSVRPLVAGHAVVRRHSLGMYLTTGFSRKTHEGTPELQLQRRRLAERVGTERQESRSAARADDKSWDIADAHRCGFVRSD